MVLFFFCRILTFLQGILLVLASPIGIAILVLLAYNLVVTPAGYLPLESINSISAILELTEIQNSIVYALIDHLVFNNGIVYIVCLLLYPSWLIIWSVLWMNCWLLVLTTCRIFILSNIHFYPFYHKDIRPDPTQSNLFTLNTALLVFMFADNDLLPRRSAEYCRNKSVL